MPTIKQLSKIDIDRLQPLWNRLKNHQAAVTRDFHNYYRDVTFEKRKQGLLVRTELLLLLAEESEKDIAFCIASVQSSKGVLESLFVDEGHRHASLGSQLTHTALQWLKQKNVTSIELLVGQGNENVVPFYEKMGFKQRAVLMTL